MLLLEEIEKHILDEGMGDEEAIGFRAGAQWGSSKSLAEEWKEIMRWKPTLHFCLEWDGLLIDKNDPEFEVCRCFPKDNK